MSLAIYQTNASASFENFVLSPALEADFELLINHVLSFDQVITNTKNRHQRSQQTQTLSLSNKGTLYCEGDFARVRIVELKFTPVEGNFDADHLKEINRRILQVIPMYKDVTLRLDIHVHVRSRMINQ